MIRYLKLSFYSMILAMYFCGLANAFSFINDNSNNYQTVENDLTDNIVINEIMYHPYHAINTPENTDEEYIELYNPGNESVDLSGWQFVSGVNFTFPNDVIIESGEYLVVVANEDVFRDKYQEINNFIGNWEGILSNSGERIELTDENGATIDVVEYADEGDWSVRELGPVDFYHRGWEWSDEHDGNGKSLELINPLFTNDYGQNWSASLEDGGTPGKINSVNNSNIAPLILNAIHFPPVPRPDDVVTVSAYVMDEMNTGVSMKLYYRLDTSVYYDQDVYPSYNPASFSVLQMFDDGFHNDGIAGDNIFAVQLPPQADGSIVEFYLEAEDSVSNSRIWPAPSMVDGVPQQVTNMLYQVDSSFDKSAWVPGSQPIYYIIMIEAERARLEDIGDEGDEFFGEGASNAQMNATFISVDGVGIKTRYCVGVRNRGNGSRTDPPMNYRVNFKNDNPWKNVTGVNINSKYPHLQILGSALFQLAGLPAANAKAVQVRVNGENLALNDYGRTFGSYAALEVYDSDWAQNHIPDDESGNLYRCTYVRLQNGSTIYADLDYKEQPGETPNPDDYRGNYPKQTNVSQDDYSDLFNLIDKLNNPGIADENFISEVGTAINIEKWLRYLATDSLLGNREGGLTTGIGDDYAMYRGIKDPRFILLPHDLDTILGRSYHPEISIFTYDNVDGLDRLLHNPVIIKLYYQKYKELLETFFTPESIYPVIDELIGDWVPESEINGYHGIHEFIIDRLNNIFYGGYPNSDDTPQIPQQFTLDCSLPFSDGLYRTNFNLLESRNISGTANAIETSFITVNGIIADWSQKNGNWSSSESISLNPGINRIFVKTYDENNIELDSKYIDIWYDNGSANIYPKDTQTEDINSIDSSDSEPVLSVNLITRDSYLPGVPVLVRVEIHADNTIDKNLWDAVANLSVDNPDVSMSTDQIVLYNGLGSSLVTFTGNGDFTLSADVINLHAEKSLTDWSDQTINNVSGSLTSSETWSGVYHITGGDYLIPDGITLSLNPGTIVLIDGVLSGTNGTDINIEGSIQSLGTDISPVTLTAQTAGENWGQLQFTDAEPSTFQYTNITQAGHSPHRGHSNSGPAINASNSTIVFNYTNLTNNAGKLMDVSSGSDLTVSNCHFARSIMGPEISATAILLENSWITDMHANDDGDGIYIHSQQVGQNCILRGGVAANIDDDAVDLLGGDVTIEDFIIRDCKDKGVSIYGGQTNINHCLVVENNKAPEDPTVASIAAKTLEGDTAIINIDHTTIVTSKIEGYVDIGVQSHNKYDVQSGTIIYNITNSIIDATDPVNVQSPYVESDIHIDYSNVFGETWPGTGNINSFPLFVSIPDHDYQLQEFSQCIDAGDPLADIDPDMTVTDQGYFWFNQEIQETAEGSLTEDTIWTAQDGPYLITNNLIVPSEITLTIMPGTTIFFWPNTKLIVNGTFIAEGEQDNLIRFTIIPDLPGTWDGLQFANTTNYNRITYAILEYAQTNNGMVDLENSKLLIDHVTFDHSYLWRIHTINSSLELYNSTFTDTVAPEQGPTDNRSEHIWGSGIIQNGQLIIENNKFGKTPGHNDAIDLEGATRPGPIPQILYNQFLGGGDEALDLETDAYIEGNIFKHYHEDFFNTDPGESNVISVGSGKNITAVRNIFYDVDHVALIKEDAFLTFTNNTVVDVNGPAIYFDLLGQTRGPGLGAEVDGCIFQDAGIVFDEIEPSTELSVSNSILPSDWHYLGNNNVDADPLFVDVPKEDFRLKPDSYAIETGPYGLDMGALIPAGAAISGEPNPITYKTNAYLTVGGPGITHYKYSINDANGPWSAIKSVEEEIILTGLNNGQSYTVYVIGLNFAGVWQSQVYPTVSKTWTVDASYSQLLINEILANTIDPNSDMVELFYDGPTPIDITGMSLTDDPADSQKFVFSGQNLTNTIMNPGDYIVLYCDEYTDLKNHVGFSLNSKGEGLYIYDKPSNQSNLIDFVEFGPQIQNYSIGRVGYYKEWNLNIPTIGQSNIKAPLGNSETLRINEWLADGKVLFKNDFIELFNPQASPVTLSGFYLTDNPVTQPNKYEIPQLSFISQEGYTVFEATGNNKFSEANFKLSPDGEIIGLFDKELNIIDQVLYGPQTTDVSQGRSPDASTYYQFFELPTPGIANTLNDTILTENTLVYEDNDKRVLVPSGPISETWNENGSFDDHTWAICSGQPGGIGYERSSGYEDYISLDLEAQMYDIYTTCYIRIPFNVESDPTNFESMTLKIRYDDGFIAYLNGTEVARRNFSGTPAWNSNASSNHDDSAAIDFEYIDITDYLGLLQNGFNILAIQGLNVSTTSSDFLISAELDAGTITSSEEYPYYDDLDVLAGLRITELMYHSPEGPEHDYIELQNIIDIPINLNGVRFTDGIQFVFPDMQLEPGEKILVVSDIASFNNVNITVAGEYEDNLSNSGEDIVLKLAKPLEAAIMRFKYSDQWYPTTDGGGESLEIIDPTAPPAMWNEATSWRPANPTPAE